MQLQKKIRTNPKYQSFVTPYPADIGTKVNSGTYVPTTGSTRYRPR